MEERQGRLSGNDVLSDTGKFYPGRRPKDSGIIFIMGNDS